MAFEVPDDYEIQFLKPPEDVAGIAKRVMLFRKLMQAVEAQYSDQATKDELLGLLNEMATAWISTASPVDRLERVKRNWACLSGGV